MYFFLRFYEILEINEKHNMNNKSRNLSGDSNNSSKGDVSGRITPDIQATQGVRVKTLENSKLSNYTPNSQNPPKNVPFKSGV